MHYCTVLAARKRRIEVCDVGSLLWSCYLPLFFHIPYFFVFLVYVPRFWWFVQYTWLLPFVGYDDDEKTVCFKAGSVHIARAPARGFGVCGEGGWGVVGREFLVGSRE